MARYVSNQPTKGRYGPSVATLFWRGATLACGWCGRRQLFRRWVHMEAHCPQCGLVFGRTEGQWIGAIGINTIVSFGLLLITIVTSLVATYPNQSTGRLILLAAAVAAIAPVLLFPLSRTFWLALDLAMKPAAPHEFIIPTTSTRPEDAATAP